MSAVSASPAASGSRADARDPVRALQHALYRAAKADPGRRFHALYDKVSRSDVLWRAWVKVRTNNGAPGIDKTTLAAVEEYGVTRLLDELASELREGRYRPMPARRVYIPKPGSDERRPLSIPAVRDRIVQAAAKIVLEPVFEADFLPCSFGFRPKRSAHDALQVLIDESWQGRRWVVETDIASCFSAIPHDKLMEAWIRRRGRAASWFPRQARCSRSSCRCGLRPPSASMPGLRGARSPLWWRRRWRSFCRAAAQSTRAGERPGGRDGIRLRPPRGHGFVGGLRHSRTAAAGPYLTGWPGRKAAL